MGSGASCSVVGGAVAASLNASTEDELRAAVQGLGPHERARVLAALRGPADITQQAMATGQSALLPEQQESTMQSSTLVNDSVNDFSLAGLKGKWRAARVFEWGLNRTPETERAGYYVWDFDDAGKCLLHHNPDARGQVRSTDASGIFEGSGCFEDLHFTLILKLDQDGKSCTWEIVFLGTIHATYYFERVPMEEWEASPEGIFHLAVERGDLEAVGNILAGPDGEALLAAPDLVGSISLHKCVYFGQASVMRLILEKATDPDALLEAVNIYKSTALHAAARAGSKEMCSLILQYTRDASSLLRQETKVGKTPFEWTKDWATAHFLCTQRKAVSVQWPAADAISEDSDHLTLGMTAQCVEEALDALKWKTYQRSAALNWVTSSCGSAFTGYDNCALVKAFFKSQTGYKPFSMLEVMLACQHPGVGRADVFLSHAQREPVILTLDCMRLYELRRQKPTRFFVDIFALRQCVKDFDLPLVKEAIQTIGHMVMVVEPWKNPFTLSRTFCAFEVFVAVNAELPFEAVSPSEELEGMLTEMCSGASSANSLDSVCVEIEKAEARNPEDKELIDRFIKEGPGFERTNSTTAAAVRTALLLQAHQLEKEGLLSVDMIGQALLDMGPLEAAKVIGAEGAKGQTFVHRLCKPSTWLQKLPLIVGGKTQRFLHAEGADGMSPLAKLVYSDDEAGIQHLLEVAEDPEALMIQPQGMSSTSPGSLPLNGAALLANLGACRALLAKASKPQWLMEQTNVCGKMAAKFAGLSCLQGAALQGWLAPCELLLAAAEDPKALVMQISIGGGYKGSTALHLAVLGGHVAVCKLLLLEARDDVQTLLMSQADSPAYGAPGSTALHYAATKGYREIIQHLLSIAPDQNALLRATDSQGHTPAMVGGPEDIGRLLEPTVL